VNSPRRRYKDTQSAFAGFIDAPACRAARGRFYVVGRWAAQWCDTDPEDGIRSEQFERQAAMSS
jgi:hypothetical protein